MVERAGADPAARRMWLLISVVVAQVRGLIADGIVLDPARIRDLNTEDYRAWTLRHGADPEAADSTLIRGLYDLVFGFRDADPDQPGFGAGLGVFLSAKTFFDYKGAVFWKMAAGMGDVVIAPLYQALRARGVEFEFFTRIDDLHLDPTGTLIDQIDITRQVRPGRWSTGLRPARRRRRPAVLQPGAPARPDRRRSRGRYRQRGLRVALVAGRRRAQRDPAARRRLRRGGVRTARRHGAPRHLGADASRPALGRHVQRGGDGRDQALQLWIRAESPSSGGRPRGRP